MTELTAKWIKFLLLLKVIFISLEISFRPFSQFRYKYICFFFVCLSFIHVNSELREFFELIFNVSIIELVDFLEQWKWVSVFIDEFMRKLIYWKKRVTLANLSKLEKSAHPHFSNPSKLLCTYFLTFATYFFFVGSVKLIICVGRFLLSSSLYLISVCVSFIKWANHTKFAPMTKWKWINKRSHGHKIKKIYDIVDPVLILFKMYIERAT